MHRLMRSEMGNGGVADANVFRVTRHWLRRVPVQLADPRWGGFLYRVTQKNSENLLLTQI